MDRKPTPFTIRSGQDQSHLLLAGELDLATADLLRKVQVPATGDLVLDLSELAFMDGSGITVIASLACRVPSGRLVLSGATGAVRRVLEIVDAQELANITVE